MSYISPHKQKIRPYQGTDTSAVPPKLVSYCV